MNARKGKNTKKEYSLSPYSHSCFYYVDMDDYKDKSENFETSEKR